MQLVQNPRCLIFAAMLMIVGQVRCTSAEETTSILKSAFQQYCVKCHNNSELSADGVDLSRLVSQQHLQVEAELLEKLISVLTDRQMPPEDGPVLPDQLRARMVERLKKMLQQSLMTLPFNSTPIRRLNRFQYNNAVVDLLELDRDIFRLNERLLRRRDDYFRPDSGKMPSVVRVSTRPLSKDVDGQRPEGFRGVASFPQDKRAEHGFDNRADHLTLSPLLMESFLQLSQTIVDSPDLNAQECRSWDDLFAPPGQPVRVAIEGRYEAEEGGPIRLAGMPKGRVWSQNMQGWGPYWSGNTQLIWMCREQSLELTLSFDATEAGRGLRFGFTKAPDYGIFEIYLDGKKVEDSVDLFDSKVIRAADHELSNLQIPKGSHTLKFKCVGKRQQSRSFLFGMDYIEVTGRAPAAKSEAAGLSDNEVIRLRLSKLLRRAFRRPVDSATLDRFATFTKNQLSVGSSVESTMRTVVGAVLGMPDFIYSYETIDETALIANIAGRQRINDFELASRLAQFFWSSIPDDTLLDLAEVGELSQPETLSAQIDRMMNDKRSSRFCDNFPAQWLQLDRLITSIPDPKKFPYFYYNGYRVSMHMMPEPLLLFETIYVENRSIVELLDANFAWQSDMLGASYEGHVNARHEDRVLTFKRVPLSDPRRGGVITNAAVMTMTSTPIRTQPITRGAWVNTVIFNNPPEPPPADVPPLPEGDKERLATLTIRERLAEHRKRADCAGCHNEIDPLGFALENFGPTGVWRDEYENGRNVDTAGVLFSKHKFETVAGFKQGLLKEKHRFVRGFASHLLSYALCRAVGPADSPALDEITAMTLAGKDGMRAVLKSVAMSEPFLHKNMKESTEDKQ